MTALRNVAALVEKEWRHYFGSPIAYVVLFVWTFLFGVFFYFGLSYFVQASMRGMQGAPSLNDYLIGPTLHNMAVSVLFLTPMITMRLFAEEKRQGTIELLATTPLTDVQIVAGKFLAALGLWAVMLFSGMLNFVILWRYATPAPEWKPMLAGALGLFLFGACYIALGTFLSTVTKNQMVAGVLSFCLFLGIWTLSWADDPSAGPIKKALAYLGPTSHMTDMIKGVIDLKDLVFFASMIFFGVFLAHQLVASERWRS
jgi:ABC-2 type transport system permease protein